MRAPGFSLCPARAPVKQACSITIPPRALTRSIRLRTRPERLHYCALRHRAWPTGWRRRSPTKVLDPVQVTIAGQPCVVTYGGTSPGSLGGLAQINAILQPTVATGQAVPIRIAGGSAQTARQSENGGYAGREVIGPSGQAPARRRLRP
jgi:hypothetical protein